MALLQGEGDVDRAAAEALTLAKNAGEIPTISEGVSPTAPAVLIGPTFLPNQLPANKLSTQETFDLNAFEIPTEMPDPERLSSSSPHLLQHIAESFSLLENV